MEAVKKCWASLFEPRAIYYRTVNKFDHMKVGLAIPIQIMVESDVAGVMFTIDPVTNDKGKIVIEAIYGLGELIVQGTVTPDHYEVDKKNNEIIVKQVEIQEKKMVRKGDENIMMPLSKQEGGRQKITDKEIATNVQSA